MGGGDPLSALGDFQCPGSQAPEPPRNAPDILPLPTSEMLRYNLLKMEHWRFFSPPTAVRILSRNSPKEPAWCPLPIQPQRYGPGSPPPPFLRLPSHSEHQNRPLTTCPGDWEGPQRVLPLRPGEGVGKRGECSPRLWEGTPSGFQLLLRVVQRAPLTNTLQTPGAPTSLPG